jgi:hypothetical protein
VTTSRPAIFLTGPIGVGKTCLGAALAYKLAGLHVEGDDHQVPGTAWFAASLHTARGILEDVVQASTGGRPVTISYPLRCYEWIFFRRRLGALGIPTVFVALSADAAAIAAPGRGRSYSAWERARMMEMISQGYDRPHFADLRIRTDEGAFDFTLDRLLEGLSRRGYTLNRNSITSPSRVT